LGQDSITLSWAPHSHVLGLVTGFLLPLYTGGTAIIMSPKDFVTNPLGWIKMLSQYKVTNCSTTLFGLEECSKICDNLVDINLTNLKYIAVGGEIVKSEVLNDFYNKFKDVGLAQNCFSPSYGMTENSGVVCSVTKKDEFLSICLNAEELSNGKLVPDNSANSVCVTSVGMVNDGDYIYVVDENNKILQDGCLGEIIISSPGLTSGYVISKDNTSFTKLKCNDGKIRRFYKTGDLGGFYNRELLITGRIKDIINLKGKKYSPYDIENIINKDLPYNIKTVVAFSVDNKDDEKIIVFEELTDVNVDKQKVKQDTCNIIKLKMNLPIYDVVFVDGENIPRTDSKKLQRQKCKEIYKYIQRR